MRWTARAYVLLAATLAAASPPVRADPADLGIATADGLELRATYYAAAGPGPGVLLLHQCNGDRRAWTEVATAMAEGGMHVLAIDFRGFGESTNGSNRAFRAQHQELWPQFDDDVERSLSFLESLPDVNADRIGVMGASCGGSQALLTSLRNPEIRAVAFLSTNLPWIDRTEVDAFEANTRIAILSIAAVDDTDAASVERRMFAGSAHPDSRLILYKGDRHGVTLFEQDPDLPGVIAAWFDTVLQGE
ncbi:alpha/beta fold hydrolase [bacterium]|nr:alpha/beta fold hydrolase [bacterium]